MPALSSVHLSELAAAVRLALAPGKTSVSVVPSLPPLKRAAARTEVEPAFALQSIEERLKSSFFARFPRLTSQHLPRILLPVGSVPVVSNKAVVVQRMKKSTNDGLKMVEDVLDEYGYNYSADTKLGKALKNGVLVAARILVPSCNL